MIITLKSVDMVRASTMHMQGLVEVASEKRAIERAERRKKAETKSTMLCVMCSISIMAKLVNRAPPLNKKNSTTSTWCHQRWAITKCIVQEIVISGVDDATYLLWGFSCSWVAHVLPIESQIPLF
jgi:hypothetical protein